MATSSTLARITQVAIIALFCALSYFFLKEGAGLIYAGAKGDWNVLLEFTGWKLYITSVAPGVAVVFGGVAIIIWGLPKILKKI